MSRSVTILLDSLATGGAEIHALKLARHLDQAGFPSSMIVYSDIRAGYLRDSDLPEHTTIMGRGSMNTDLVGWLRTGRAIAASRPAVVVAVNQAAFAVAAIAKMMGLYRAPLLCLFHGFLPPAGRDRMRLPIFRQLLRLSDALVYVSRNQRDFWRSRHLSDGPDHVIRNGVDLDAYRPFAPEARQQMRARLGLGEEELAIGLVAQFRPEKNQAQLVEAAAALRSRGIPVTPIFVGDGAGRAEVEARAAALGMSAFTRFVGEQRDVRPFLGALDAAVLCSVTETLPLSALEALACGIPVILPDIGGASEIVAEDVNGWLYPVRDTNALEQRLDRLTRPAERENLRRGARASVEQRFDERRMLAEYEALIETYSG